MSAKSSPRDLQRPSKLTAVKANGEAARHGAGELPTSP
jgi:hypothetical protein